ncbi:hypothetical protein ACFSJU_02540 [Paradesertivirga mongoliensis]|uniref:Uncharacterized protein n=1 Tax=Paradesertivirga mongoliensis TaxID=2100740 RepID=A0ABW4ZGT2_9SPHI|nr:hypothetical protein [Pedobacter mongoliensis]
MFDEIEKLPVYQKAREILILAEHICDSLKDDDQKEHIEHQILSNASVLGAKIAGAAGCESYTLKMENLLKIKFAVREMFEGILFARLIKINPNDYVQLMRDAIEEFRIEFVKWIRTFDPTGDLKDDWAIRYVVDRSDDYTVKMVSDEVNPDPDDSGSTWFDWDDDDL